MLEKTVAIVQSNYIPWRGYFDLIAKSDEFILYDDMQFTKNDWRNRNKIKTANGLLWLTIPVRTKGLFGQKISETTVSDQNWAEKHWRSISLSYAIAPYFAIYHDFFAALYRSAGELSHLSAINFQFLTAICELMKIETKILWSKNYPLVEGKTERVAHLCRAAGGTCYVSGPSARDYLRPEVFAELGIKLRFIDYSTYQAYPQLYGDFQGQVSILDQLFMCGAESTRASLCAPLSSQ